MQISDIESIQSEGFATLKVAYKTMNASGIIGNTWNANNNLSVKENENELEEFLGSTN